MDTQALKLIITHFMQAHHIPGLSLAMIKEQQLVLHLELGVKHSITKEPIDSFTVFEAASLTKPLIAYAALKMCHDGLLDLDQPLSFYLSKSYRENPPLLSFVTLRHILSHTAGFPTANLKIGEPLKIGFYPGSQFAYSGESFRYLAFVMEHLTGVSLSSYFQQHIFKPLQMTESSLIWKKEYNQQSATPHDGKGKPLEKWKPQQTVASFSLHTTAIDFAKFMIEVIRQSQQNSPMNMLKPQVEINEFLSWGLGWGIEKTPLGKAFWHSGDNGGFQCFALAFQEQRGGIVMMTNSCHGLKICQQIVEHSIGGDHPLFAWEQFDSNNDNVNDEFLSNWWTIYGV